MLHPYRGLWQDWESARGQHMAGPLAVDVKPAAEGRHPADRISAPVSSA